MLRYSIPYTAIQSATSQRRMFHLIYLSLDGEETSLDFKLDSSQSASGLYRAITEKHAFYSCETVRSAVTAQFIRDLKVSPQCQIFFKYFSLHIHFICLFYIYSMCFYSFHSSFTSGFFFSLSMRTLSCFRTLLSIKSECRYNRAPFQGTIISIFNEDSTLGKKYVFDIRRTCREVYDNARRALYCEAATIALPEENEILDRHACGECENPKCKVSNGSRSQQSGEIHRRAFRYINDPYIFQESRECLARLLDAMLCRICMDRSLDTALFPCGHAVACLDCARRCERCPLCRADIDYCRTIYLPIELTHIDKHNPKLLSETIEPVFSKPLTEEIKDKRILDSEPSVNSNIWERGARHKPGAFERFFRIVTCRADRAYWNTGRVEALLCRATRPSVSIFVGTLVGFHPILEILFTSAQRVRSHVQLCFIIVWFITSIFLCFIFLFYLFHL